MGSLWTGGPLVCCSMKCLLDRFVCVHCHYFFIENRQLFWPENDEVYLCPSSRLLTGRMKMSCSSRSWSIMSPTLSPCPKKLLPSARGWGHKCLYTQRLSPNLAPKPSLRAIESDKWKCVGINPTVRIHQELTSKSPLPSTKSASAI